MKPPAFQFYADDFLAGVADMTQAEVGAYILLLCHQWNRGSAPVQPERQQLLAKGPVSDYVLSKFKPSENGELKNERLEKERQRQAEFRELQRLKGQKSGESRANKGEPGLNRGSTEGQPNTQPKHNSPSPSPSPINNKEAAAMPPVLDTDSFKAAWAEYVEYRRTSKLRKLKPKSVESLLAKMAEWGEQAAIEGIQTTIRNGWQGVFEPKSVGGQAQPKPQPQQSRRVPVPVYE